MSRRTRPLCRALLSACVLATVACGSGGRGAEPKAKPAEHERADTPVPAPAPGSVEPETTPSPAIGRILTFAPAVGEVWFEEVQDDLFSHRSDELPSETPTVRTRRRERFAILSADAEVIRVQVTQERLRIELKDHEPFDSDTSEAAATMLHLDQLAFVGIPIVFRLSRSGETLEVEEVEATRGAIDRRWGELRAAAEHAEADAEKTSQWRRHLNTRLTSYAEWGIRPTFPESPVTPATPWTETVRASSLFNAELTWAIEHTLRDDGGELLTIDREGDAVFKETPAMLLMISRADATLSGEVVLDPETAALLRSETTVSAMVEIRSQEDPGRTLKMRNTVTRRRVTEDPADPERPGNSVNPADPVDPVDPEGSPATPEVADAPAGPAPTTP